MIPSGVEVFVGTCPIDLRWGFDRLAGVVQERLGRMPRSGALFLFFGKRRTAVKILFFDGTGLCLFYKRLDRRLFCMPEASHRDAASIEISERELETLLDGVDVRPATASRRRHARTH